MVETASGAETGRSMKLPYTERTTIEANHPALVGHFPGRPVVPGVVLLDMVARAVSTAAGGEMEIAAVRAAKFRAGVLPGDDLRIELNGDGEGVIQFRIMRGETVAADGTLVVKRPV